MRTGKLYVDADGDIWERTSSEGVTLRCEGGSWLSDESETALDLATRMFELVPLVPETTTSQESEPASLAAVEAIEDAIRADIRDAFKGIAAEFAPTAPVTFVDAIFNRAADRVWEAK